MFTSHELQALVEPPSGAADHLFHRSSEPRQSNRSAIRAVAVGAGAVRDKKRVRRVLHKVPLVDAAMGQVHCTRDMAGGKQLWAPNVKHDEALMSRLERCIDVRAVGFDGNLTATFLTIKSVLPGMKERRAGNIRFVDPDQLIAT
jgi:hypothetical protein